ncbi:hypothetical protein SEA_TIMINATOR_64 [Arthrobacter phage Timinator]|uniref:Uncharacterized protein n=2 Tax=Marthavirus barretlemon TaxID=2560300 RepID=A0A386KLL8_9CAUD|nr:hypothetical protein SEA_TIMINATOR_64 [Arthrobacter phage Timinator]AYD86535.1 hypothetical protein SEA_LEEROYJ_64 [Arthrobacter phage LeeroyJ]
MTTNGYVISTANSMLDDITRPVDITGQYGPQSVDLIIYYVRELTGVKWAGPTQHARDLMHAPGLRIWFDAVEPADLQYGDIVVLHGFDTSDFGTTGVFMQWFSDKHVEIFGQTPHNPQKHLMLRESIVGGLRYKYVGPLDKTNILHKPRTLDIWTPASGEPSPLRDALLKDTPAEKRAVLGEFMVNSNPKTAGEECVEEYDKWVAQNIKRGPVMSCTFHANCATGEERVNLDDAAQPGDVIVWDSHIPSMFGHVAVVRPKRAGWLRRISNWLGITREELEAVRQEPKE